MKIKKFLISIFLICFSLFSNGASGKDYEGLLDSEFGYFDLESSLTASILYTTSDNGIYTMLVELNGHNQYSSTIAISDNTKRNIGFLYITFDKEWLYASKNVLRITVFNTMLVEPVIMNQKVTFNCGFCELCEFTAKQTMHTGPMCYVAIRNGKLSVFCDMFLINKNDEYVSCKSNNLNLKNNYFSYTLASKKDTNSSLIAHLIIRKNYDSFSIGEINYDSSKNEYYRSIPLQISRVVLGGANKEIVTAEEHAVSSLNLRMFDKDKFTGEKDMFLSSDIFIPIGLKENNVEFVTQILIENIGYFKSTFLLKTTYYPCSENFGACYIGDYCIIKGEGR